MKKILATILLSVIVLLSFAQEAAEKEIDKPVRQPFESAYLIDNQTTYIPYKRTLEYVIQHKFGTVENGISDLFGIYAPGANVRIGFNYVPIENLQVGWGLTKTNFTNDFNIKYSVFEQTRKNTFPVALTLYGVAGINGQPDDFFGRDYTFTGRMSYFAQAIISRKFSQKFTMQLAGSFSHFNMVDRENSDFDKIGVHVNGRYKFSPQMSVIFNVDQPLPYLMLRNKEGMNASTNVAAGLEISTSTHAFQIYAGQYSGVLPQDIMVKNYNPFEMNNFAIGFTITRLWNL